MVKTKRKHYKRRSWLAKAWRRYEYKHSTMAVLAVGAFVLLLDTTIIQGSLSYVEKLGIFGIILAGIMFTSFFTTAPAIVLLLAFNDLHSPLDVAFYGAIGAVIGDWIILRFFEEKVAYELRPLAKKLNLMRFIRQLRRKKNRERATLMGMLVIASPVPDEIGIGLLGIAHLPTISLLIITFLLNAAGILVLLLFV